MAAATHKGTCQICGRLQALPKGRLSNHGYTVQWGWFEGTCSGSKGLPFEQSTDLIEGVIARCKMNITDLEKKIEETRNYEGPLGWRNNYYSYGERGYGSKSAHVWEQVEIKIERTHTMSDGSEFHSFTADRKINPEKMHNSSKRVNIPFEVKDKSLAGAIKHCNEQYIEHVLKRRISQLEQYIAWQQERVDNWKPAELVEIKR